MTPTKILIPLLLLFAPFLGAVEEHHKQPTETFAEALNQLPNGGTLFLSGTIPYYDPEKPETYYQKIKVSNHHYSEASPLIIDGQGITISYQPVDFSDCAHVVLKGVQCYGGLGLNSSTTDYSKVLQYITIENCLFKYGKIFSGGYSFHHITIRGCTIQEIIYKKATDTHGIYFSGGHWIDGAGMPHPHDILVEGCVFRWMGGRHGMQFNGCFDHVKVLNNKFYCCNLSCLQLIGVQHFEVAYNEMLLGNRGCMILFDYDDNWWTGNKAYMELWCQVHHPTGFGEIHHNTFLVGPTEWCNWQNPSTVKDRPAILLNNEMAELQGVYKWPDGSEFLFEYKTPPIWIHHNVMASPWANMIEYHDVSTPWATHVTDNMVYTMQAGSVPLVTFAKDALPQGADLAYTFQFLEQHFPGYYSGNITDVDPKFKRWPELPHASEIPPHNGFFPPDSNYIWSMWPGKFNLFSSNAARLGKGAYDKKDTLWTRGGLVQRKKPKPMMGGPAKLEGTIKMSHEDLRKIIEGK